MTITPELLKKYTKPGFGYVETGSAGGDSLQVAKDCGAKSIVGIEIQQKFINVCKKRFGDEAILIQGDSAMTLGYAVKKCSVWPVVVYLDAHKVDKDCPGGFPLMAELQELRGVAKYISVVMIDDVRLFKTELRVDIQNVIRLVRKINPGFNITYEDSLTFAKDIMVAYL